MRKLRFVVVIFVALTAFVGFNLFASATAHAQTTAMSGCAQQANIETLEACVHHCADQGLITKQWVTLSLLDKLDSAENAVSYGRTARAINALNAFIAEVNAQSGTTIDPMHAMHLVMHAQIVIQTLENT